MTTTEPPFYDVAMTGTRAPSLLPLEDSPWLPLYLEGARWIAPAPAQEVVDLGCGTGRFAHQLRALGHYGDYLGVDFSRKTLAEAERYCRQWRLGGVSFAEGDLRTWTPDPLRTGRTIYVSLEVLEHLEDDLGLLARIPPGHRLIFSVPNHESQAHLRIFRSLGEVWERYGPLFTFSRWSLVELDGRRRSVHLCDAWRRADSW